MTGRKEMQTVSLF